MMTTAKSLYRLEAEYFDNGRDFTLNVEKIEDDRWDDCEDYDFRTERYIDEEDEKNEEKEEKFGYSVPFSNINKWVFGEVKQ